MQIRVTARVVTIRHVSKRPPRWMRFLTCRTYGTRPLGPTWLIMPVELDLIFEIPPAASWEMAIRRLGADPSLLQMSPCVH